MKKRRHTKLGHVENYVAEVDIELIDSEEGWSPLFVRGRRQAIRQSQTGASPGRLEGRKPIVTRLHAYSRARLKDPRFFSPFSRGRIGRDVAPLLPLFPRYSMIRMDPPDERYHTPLDN
jgi:hypothetical protein